MTQRTRAVFQATDVAARASGVQNPISSERTCWNNLAESVPFAGELKQIVPVNRWLVPTSFGGLSNATMANTRIVLTPLVIGQNSTYDQIGYGLYNGSSVSAKMGIYADLGGRPTGSPLAGSTVTVGPGSATNTQTAQAGSFSVALALTISRIWLAMITDSGQGCMVVNNAGHSDIFGVANLGTANGAFAYAAGTYAGGLTDLTAASLTYADGTGCPFMGIRRSA